MTDRPPPRRGLGRGLGSLIPTGPLPPESRQHDEGVGAPAEAPSPEWPAATPPGAPTATATATVTVPIETRASGAPEAGPAVTTPADWIGRIPAPTAPTSGAASGPTSPIPGENRDSDLQPVQGAYFAELPVDSISPNAKQPRQVFDEESMAELVHSIVEVGLLQPVVVRRTGDASYELIMGERRWRATQEAGLGTIPAIVRDTGDDAMLRDALLENLHRAQLNPLEEAAAYQQLLDDFGCTHEELATRIGRSRPQISNTLRLLKLTPAVQRRVAAGVLSAGHARTLLAVPDPAAQDRLAGRVVAEGISVRGLEELVTVGELGGAERVARKRATPTAPGVVHLSERLSDRFDTRVKVDLGRSKGRITIEFASLEDLERIVALMDPSYPGRAPSEGS